MDRRQVMKSVATFGGVGLAGCLTSGSIGSNGTRLGVIEIINFSQVRNRIRVLVVRDGETLLDEKYGLKPFDAGVEGSTEIIQPRWAMESGRYTLKVSHYGADGDRETTGSEYTFTEEDYNSYYGDGVADPGCIGAIVKIGSNASKANAPIGISPTMIENPCGNKADPQ